jgi:hypothetical protein
MPVIDGILPIDVARDCHHGNCEETMCRQEVAQRKTEKSVAVQLLGVKR